MIQSENWLTQPAVHDLWAITEKLPDFSENGAIFAESLALREVMLVSLQHAIYFVFYGSWMENFDFSRSLSGRISFLEVTWLSLITIVHHFCVALFYTGLVIVTLGHSKQLNYQFHKHWVHTGIGVMTLAFSVAGVVSPYVGIGLSALWFKDTVLNGLQNDFTSDMGHYDHALVRTIQDYFEKHRDTLHETCRGRYQDYIYAKCVEPSLIKIETSLRAASEMNQVIAIARDIYRYWPNLVTPEEGSPVATETPPARVAAHQHQVDRTEKWKHRVWGREFQINREHRRGFNGYSIGRIA